MPRDLVNVILDRTLDSKDIERAALDQAAASKARLSGAIQQAYRLTSDPEEARQLVRDAFVGLVLAEVARSAPAAMRLAEASLRAEAKAVLAVGVPKARSIPALKKPHLMARASERAGTDGRQPG